MLPSYLVAAVAIAAAAPAAAAAAAAAASCHCCCSALTIAVAVAADDAAAAVHMHALSLVVWFMCACPVLALCSICGTSAPPLTCNSIINILCSMRLSTSLGYL